MKKIRKNRRLINLFRAIKSPKNIFKKFNYMWIITIVVMGFIYWLFSSSTFKISQIECATKDDAPCDPNIIAELEKQKGKLIFTFNTHSLEEKIKKADPLYSGVGISVSLPNKLTLNMDQKKSYANLQVSSSSASLIVDQNRVVVSKSPHPSPGIFTIIVDSATDYSVGDSIEDEKSSIAFDIAAELKKNYLPFSQILFKSNSEIIVFLPEDKHAIITGTKDITRQVTSLQLILSKATISPEPQVYDMRFDKPVLKY